MDTLADPLLESFEDFLRRSLARPGTSRFAEVAGIRMHYLEWEGPPGAPALLLLHGFLAHAHWWDFIAPWLAEHYRVIVPDLGGMGDSGRREQYVHDQFHDEIAGIVAATGIAGCTGIGHSFGGRALLYAAHRHPHLFRRGIVVDSRLGSPRDPIRGFDEEWRPNKLYPAREQILQRFVLRPPEPSPAAALAHMAACSVRQEGDAWTWKFDENVTRLYRGNPDAHGIDDHAELRDLTLPVDFVYGEESRVVTPDRAQLLHHCLQNVRSVTGLPSSYHHLPVSQPIALLGVLRVLLQTG